ncbi:MAG: M24 family metallopeptidase, partial [Bdellovibrionales bacterium]|nr:M24 family metallopeptidase [Bdellovibrionales bacterium]
HGIGHWLGSDVHDAGKYKIKDESRKLEPGMVFTIEPGIYIPLDDSFAPEELKGIGIRIEDNILVTPEGHENLTLKAPKEVSDLETIIGSKS